MNEDKALAHGYVIADTEGRVQMDTFRSNPAETWRAFLGNKNSRKNREFWKRHGFRLARGWFAEARAEE